MGNQQNSVVRAGSSPNRVGWGLGDLLPKQEASQIVNKAIDASLKVDVDIGAKCNVAVSSLNSIRAKGHCKITVEKGSEIVNNVGVNQNCVIKQMSDVNTAADIKSKIDASLDAQFEAITLSGTDTNQTFNMSYDLSKIIKHQLNSECIVGVSQNNELVCEDGAEIIISDSKIVNVDTIVNKCLITNAAFVTAKDKLVDEVKEKLKTKTVGIFSMISDFFNAMKWMWIAVVVAIGAVLFGVIYFFVKNPQSFDKAVDAAAKSKTGGLGGKIK
jgi:uncharacterized membrane protein